MAGAGNSQEELEKLRSAAESGDSETCADVIPLLFTHIDAHVAIQFVVAQAQDFLPTFEKQNPEITWPREVILAVEKLEPINVTDPKFRFFEESRVDDSNGIPIPSALPFVNAMECLRFVPQRYHDRDKQEWYEQGALDVGMAFFNIVEAQMWSDWAAAAPSEYLTYWTGRGDEATLDEYVQSLEIFRESADRKRCHRTRFLAAADELEKLLSGSNNDS